MKLWDEADGFIEGDIYFGYIYYMISKLIFKLYTIFFNDIFR